jgi:hypothetical protein
VVLQDRLPVEELKLQRSYDEKGAAGSISDRSTLEPFFVFFLSFFKAFFAVFFTAFDALSFLAMA